MRGTVVLALVAVVVVVLVFSAHDAVTALESKAAAREKEAARMEAMGAELTSLEDSLRTMRAALGAGEPVLGSIERAATQEALVLASSRSVGAREAGGRRDVLTSFRVSAAPLKPLIRLLAGLESSRTGLIVQELVVRRSVDRRNRLDAEVVVAQMVEASTERTGRE